MRHKGIGKPMRKFYRLFRGKFSEKFQVPEENSAKCGGLPILNRRLNLGKSAVDGKSGTYVSHTPVHFDNTAVLRE
jgi:hypothetical protein